MLSHQTYWCTQEHEAFTCTLCDKSFLIHIRLTEHIETKTCHYVSLRTTYTQECPTLCTDTGIILFSAYFGYTEYTEPCIFKSFLLHILILTEDVHYDQLNCG